jgi:peptide/nickel transport system permease protein
MSVAELEARAIELEAPSGLWRDVWFRLRTNPAAIAGFTMIGLFVLVAIFAPFIAPEGPDESHLERIIGGCCPGPSRDHLMGVDQLGRDEFSRILFGARYSLVVGVVSGFPSAP